MAQGRIWRPVEVALPHKRAKGSFEVLKMEPEVGSFMPYSDSNVDSEVGSFMPYSDSNVDSEVGSIAWTKELETGIDVLDEQHRRYIELLNDYIEKVTEYDRTPDIKVIQLTESLNFLREYAKEHFSAEESIMKDAEYPDFETHQEEHLHFLRRVGELSKDMDTKGFSPKLSREVNYYTIEWFIEHILASDMQLVEFLRLNAGKRR